VLGVTVKKEVEEADKKRRAIKSRNSVVVDRKEFDPKMGLDGVVKPGTKYRPRTIAAVEQYLASGPPSTQKRLVFKLLEFPWRTTEELVDGPSVVSKGNKSPRSVAAHLHPLDIIDFANKRLRSHGAEIVKVRTAKGFAWGFVALKLPDEPAAPAAGANRTKPASPYRSQR